MEGRETGKDGRKGGTERMEGRKERGVGRVKGRGEDKGKWRDERI